MCRRSSAVAGKSAATATAKSSKMRACSSSREIASARISCSLRLLKVRTVRLENQRRRPPVRTFPRRAWERREDGTKFGPGYRRLQWLVSELLPAEAIEGSLGESADGLDDAFLNFDSRRAAARVGLVGDCDAVVARLLKGGNHAIHIRIFIERLHELRDRQHGHIHLHRQDRLVAVLAGSIEHLP